MVRVLGGVKNVEAFISVLGTTIYSINCSLTDFSVTIAVPEKMITILSTPSHINHDFQPSMILLRRCCPGKMWHSIVPRVILMAVN